MSVLQALQIILEMDSSDVTKSAKESEDAIKGVINESEKSEKKTKKSSNENTKANKKASSSAKALEGVYESLSDTVTGHFSSVAGSITALVGVASMFTGVLNEAFETDKLALFAESMNQPIEKISALDNEVKRLGGDAGDFQSSLQSLSVMMGDLAMNGGDMAMEFSRVGVNILDSSGKVKDSMSILSELTDKFDELDPDKAKYFADALGIEPSVLRMMRESGESLDQIIARQKELGVVTKDDAEAARSLRESTSLLNQSWQSLYRTIATNITPSLSWFYDGLANITRFVSKNGKLVTAFFTGISAVLALKFLPLIKASAISTWAMLAPFLAIGAAVAAIGAVFAAIAEDIYHFINGNDSLIGRISGKYPAVKKAIDSVRVSFSNLGKAIKSISDVFRGLFIDPLRKMLGFASESEMLSVIMKKLGDVAIWAFTAPIKAISLMFDHVSKMIGLLESGVEKVAEFFGFDESDDQEKKRGNKGFFARIKSSLSGNSKEERINDDTSKDVRKFIIEGNPELIDISTDVADVKGNDLDFNSSISLGMINDELAESAIKASEVMSMSQSSPINSISSNQLNSQNHSVSRNNSVNVGSVSVDARGGDSKEISKNIGSALSDEFNRVINQYDDGVLI